MARDNRNAGVLVELSVANALASQLFDRELTRVGLRPVQVGLLTIVSMHGPATPTVLERESGLPPSTLRERLRVLEDAGLVHRVSNPRDGRSHFVEITPEGVAFLKRASAAVRAVESEISEALGTPLETYRVLLERLRRAEQSLLARAVPLEGEGPGTEVVFR